MDGRDGGTREQPNLAATGTRGKADRDGRDGDARLLEQGAGFAVDVVDDVAVIVEKHALTGFGRVEWPLGERSAIGVTCAHKSKECISHFGGECTWTSATSRVGHH